MRVLALTMGVVTLLLCGIPADAAPDNLSSALEAVLKDNFAKSEKEDVDGVLSTIHPESPAYDVVGETMESLFDTFDLRYELVYFRLIGTDGSYAVARVGQKTVKVKGPDFSNNTIDSIYVFKKQDDMWKLWHQVMLQTEIIE